MENWPLIHPGDTVSDEHVQHIYTGLCEQTLPEPEWTHGAHLCAGTAILADRGLTKAEADMPDIIRTYNLACGKVNSDTEGYHHTMTLLYLRALNKALDGRWDEPVGHLASDILASPKSERSYPLTLYSRETLFSVNARREWVPPDIHDV